MGTDYTVSTLVETFRRDGVVVLDSFLTRPQIDAIRSEGEALRERFAPDYAAKNPVKIRGGWRLDIPPVNLIRRGGASFASETCRFLGHPLIRSICESILGRRWFPGTLAFDYREPSETTIPRTGFKLGYPPAYFWHVDMGLPGLVHPGRFSLRFQTYLNDTTLENGALGYAKGTHRLVKHVRERHKASPPATLDENVIDSSDSLIRAAERLRAAPGGLAAEYQEILDRFKRDAPGWDHVSKEAALEYPAGSVVVFDDTGMHRGNFVQQDHRFVFRYVCNPERPLEQLRTLKGAKNYFARQFYRGFLAEPYRYLA